MSLEEPDEADPIGAFGFVRLCAPWLLAHRALAAVLLGAFFVTSAVEAAVLPLGFKVLIDDVLTPRDARLLPRVLGVLVAAGVVYVAVTVARDVLHARLSQTVLNELRQALYERCLSQSSGFFARRPPNELAASFAGDLTSVEFALTIGMTYGIAAVFGFVVSVPTLFAVESRLAGLAMVSLALAAVGPLLLNRRAVGANHALREDQAALVARIHSDLNAHATVRAFDLRPRFFENLRARLAAYRRVSTRTLLLNGFAERTPNLTMMIFLIATLVIGSVLVFRNELSLGVLVSFQAMSVALSASVANVTWALPYFLGAAAGMARIDTILREPVEVEERPGAIDLGPFSSALEVSDVVFAPNGARVLDGMTLRIAAGSSIGIVGPSGSGKSTLLSLLARFYDPHAGAIRLDGTDLRSATLSSLRRQVGVVFQDNVVVEGTLADNLRLGREDATDAELAGVLADVSLDGLAAGPEGLDVLLGEKGARISGGQRQRLAIARALLRGAPVLLLDEATSALDAETEASVLATIERVSVGKTVIAVTHRLATVERADRIFVLDGGRVVEAGTHAELLGVGGLYKRLWDKQHGLQVAADGSGAIVSPTWLRAIPVFAELDDETLATLSRDFQPERFEADRVVVHEGDPGDRFFALVHGDAEVIQTSASGRSERVSILRDGDCFGDLALLLDQPRTATIRMLSPGHLVSLRRGPFLALVERFPGLRGRLVAEAKERMKRVGAAPAA